MSGSFGTPPSGHLSRSISGRSMSFDVAIEDEPRVAAPTVARVDGTLHRAIKAKDIDKVRSLLSESRAESLELCVRSRMSAAPKLYAQIGYRFMWWFHTPWWLCTPLQYAAIHDTISGDITVALIRSGADVNNCGSLQASPLHIAAATKNKVFIQALANHRTPNSMHVDLELQDACGRTPDSVSTNKDIQELISQLREGNSESTNAEWQMVEIARTDSSKRPHLAARAHPEKCECVGCKIGQDSDNTTAIESETKQYCNTRVMAKWVRDFTEGILGDNTTARDGGNAVAVAAQHSAARQRIEGGVSVSFNGGVSKEGFVPAGTSSGATSHSGTSSGSSQRDEIVATGTLSGLHQSTVEDSVAGSISSIIPKASGHESATDQDNGRNMSAASGAGVPAPSGMTRSLQNLVSRIFPSPQSNKFKKSLSRADSIDNDSLVTFCLIDFDDLDVCPDRLARGSFGDVYKGTWKGYTVAVKMLRHVGGTDLQEDDAAAMAARKKQIDMLLHEIRIFEELKHPNIIGFHGASLRAGRLYFCTEFATHGSLYHFLHECASTVYGPETVYRWSLEIAHGMDFLAEKNILHRDLKSPNILLTNVESQFKTSDKPSPDTQAAQTERADSSGGLVRVLPMINCKICDFGLSHKVGNAKGAAAGTVRWMAPEALKKKQITLQSDVYSYGVVLWELITRERPWKDLNEAQVIWAVAELDQRLPVPDGYPADITAIVQQCWLSKPKERPTWKELAQKLKTAADILSVESWPAIKPQQAQAQDAFGTIDGMSKGSTFASSYSCTTGTNASYTFTRSAGWSRDSLSFRNEGVQPRLTAGPVHGGGATEMENISIFARSADSDDSVDHDSSDVASHLPDGTMHRDTFPESSTFAATCSSHVYVGDAGYPDNLASLDNTDNAAHGGSSTATVDAAATATSSAADAAVARGVGGITSDTATGGAVGGPSPTASAGVPASTAATTTGAVYTPPGAHGSDAPDTTLSESTDTPWEDTAESPRASLEVKSTRPRSGEVSPSDGEEL